MKMTHLLSKVIKSPLYAWSSQFSCVPTRTLKSALNAIPTSTFFKTIFPFTESCMWSSPFVVNRYTLSESATYGKINTPRTAGPRGGGGGEKNKKERIERVRYCALNARPRPAWRLCYYTFYSCSYRVVQRDWSDIKKIIGNHQKICRNSSEIIPRD